MMNQDKERSERVKNALRDGNLDAVLCALPSNVLMLTGYFPVVGTSVAIFTREGEICLLAPEDERELAARSRADRLRTFKPGSLEELRNAYQAVQKPLEEALNFLRLSGKRIGYERGAYFQPASYAAMHFYGAGLIDLLEAAEASPVSADCMLARLRSVKTPFEIERIRAACRIAGRAFKTGKRHLQINCTEREVAAFFRTSLETLENADENIERAEGFVFCASGENSVKADAAYQRSRAKRLKENEFVLVHCNSHADGYWTDVTRTFLLDRADEKKRRISEAVFAARAAALSAIRPGVKAAEVDKAAREVIEERGYGEYFTHATGHEVGFSAINHDAIPRIHPASEDVLETGMTFNVEPAIYIEGIGGFRHCDMVAVTENGYEILTPFQTKKEELLISIEEMIVSSICI